MGCCFPRAQPGPAARQEEERKKKARGGGGAATEVRKKRKKKRRRVKKTLTLTLGSSAITNPFSESVGHREILEKSWMCVVSQGKEVAESLINEVIIKSPDCSQIFAKDRRQAAGKAVVAFITKVTKDVATTDINDMIVMVEDLGKRHQTHVTAPENYFGIFRSVILGFVSKFDLTWNKESRQVWDEFFDFLEHHFMIGHSGRNHLTDWAPEPAGNVSINSNPLRPPPRSSPVGSGSSKPNLWSPGSATRPTASFRKLWGATTTGHVMDSLRAVAKRCPKAARIFDKRIPTIAKRIEAGVASRMRNMDTNGVLMRVRVAHDKAGITDSMLKMFLEEFNKRMKDGNRDLYIFMEAAVKQLLTRTQSADSEPPVAKTIAILQNTWNRTKNELPRLFFESLLLNDTPIFRDLKASMHLTTPQDLDRLIFVFRQSISDIIDKLDDTPVIQNYMTHLLLHHYLFDVTPEMFEEAEKVFNSVMSALLHDDCGDDVLGAWSVIWKMIHERFNDDEFVMNAKFVSACVVWREIDDDTKILICNEAMEDIVQNCTDPGLATIKRYYTTSDTFRRVLRDRILEMITTIFDQRWGVLHSTTMLRIIGQRHASFMAPESMKRFSDVFTSLCQKHTTNMVVTPKSRDSWGEAFTAITDAIITGMRTPTPAELTANRHLYEPLRAWSDDPEFITGKRLAEKLSRYPLIKEEFPQALSEVFGAKVLGFVKEYTECVVRGVDDEVVAMQAKLREVHRDRTLTAQMHDTFGATLVRVITSELGAGRSDAVWDIMSSLLAVVLERVPKTYQQLPVGEGVEVKSPPREPPAEAPQPSSMLNLSGSEQLDAYHAQISPGDTSPVSPTEYFSRSKPNLSASSTSNRSQVTGLVEGVIKWAEAAGCQGLRDHWVGGSKLAQAERWEALGADEKEQVVLSAFAMLKQEIPGMQPFVPAIGSVVKYINVLVTGDVPAIIDISETFRHIPGHKYLPWSHFHNFFGTLSRALSSKDHPPSWAPYDTFASHFLASTPPLTPAYVSQHNTPEDCYVIIKKRVYNVTRFLKDHPGGRSVILKWSGKDATDPFTKLHSSSAWKRLPDFYIGDVAYL